MLVMTAWVGFKWRKLRSNSSASTTSRLLALFSTTLEPVETMIPPKNALHPPGVSANRWVSMAVVVVLPWVPATANVSKFCAIKPSISLRFKTGNWSVVIRSKIG